MPANINPQEFDKKNDLSTGGGFFSSVLGRVCANIFKVVPLARPISTKMIPLARLILKNDTLGQGRREPGPGATSGCGPYHSRPLAGPSSMISLQHTMENKASF